MQKEKETLRATMIKELANYEEKQKHDKNLAVGKMLKLMNTYYTNMKKDVKIDEDGELEDEDYELEDVLNTLKPNTTTKNFKDFLKTEDNTYKNQEWRYMSRALHTEEAEESKRLEDRANNHFFNTRHMRVRTLVDAYEKNYREVNQPLLEQPKQLKLLERIAKEHQDNRPGSMFGREPDGEILQHQFDLRDSSYIKAELIKRNLLSRKDLMQLYRPPLKRSEIASNNPFLSRTIV